MTDCDGKIATATVDMERDSGITTDDELDLSQHIHSTAVFLVPVL